MGLFGGCQTSGDRSLVPLDGERVLKHNIDSIVILGEMYDVVEKWDHILDLSAKFQGLQQ